MKKKVRSPRLRRFFFLFFFFSFTETDLSCTSLRRLSRTKRNCQGNGDPPFARSFLRFWMHFHVITGSPRHDAARRDAAITTFVGKSKNFSNETFCFRRQILFVESEFEARINYSPFVCRECERREKKKKKK